jgi:kynurenine formamidase
MRTESISTRPVLLCALILTAFVTACAQGRPDRILDLTYPFDEATVYWPTNKSFQWEKTAWGITSEGYWYASADFAASEHGGTHIDAPIHFGQGRNTVDQIPVSQLIGPAVLVDITQQCGANVDYELTVDDLKQWESRHGVIEDGSLVLIRTGWGQHWSNQHRYLGSDTLRDVSTLHFPGVSRQAAHFLVTERAIRGMGIDTASIDPGRSRNFPVHQVLSQANVYALVLGSSRYR